LIKLKLEGNRKSPVFITLMKPILKPLLALSCGICLLMDALEAGDFTWEEEFSMGYYDDVE
jgi:hypothetical protein